MSDPTNAGGASDQGASGAGAHATSSGQEDLVPRADHKRALDDMHKFKEKARAYEAELATMKSTVEEMQQKMHASNKDYESLFNQEKEKRTQAEKDRERLKESVVLNERYKAVYPALKKAGLRDDAENLLDHMDLTAIEVEATSNGRFLCSGVESFIEVVRAKYPYAFQKPQAPNVNGSSGSGQPPSNEAMTPSKLVEIERQCRKKGDMAPYKAAVAEWQKARVR